MKNKSLFLRTLSISLVVVLCSIFGFLGCAKAYKSIRLVAFGEYKDAVELKDGVLRIFDIEIEI